MTATTSIPSRDDGARVSPDLGAHHVAVAALCLGLGIRRLAAFGPAVAGRFEGARSDVGRFTEFDPSRRAQRHEAYIELKEGLEAPFGRRVGPLTPAPLAHFATTVPRDK